jgi:hypothetical protein
MSAMRRAKGSTLLGSSRSGMATATDRRSGLHEASPPGTENLMTATLHVHICSERRGYNVTFSTEDQAIAFLAPKSSTHAWWELTPEDASGVAGSVPASWVKLLDFLYPLCEHGMAGDCYGPNHFMTAEQEQAMDWQYADAPSGF